MPVATTSTMSNAAPTTIAPSLRLYIPPPRQLVTSKAYASAARDHLLGEAYQQHERSHREDDAGHLEMVQRLAEHHHADRGQQQDHGDRIEHANGGQLHVPHHEHPAESGRGVEDEPEIEPPCPERLLARAREL